MFYTSFSPNEERFGFSTRGSFKCAFANERLVAIGIYAYTGILLFLIGAQIYSFINLFDLRTGALKDGMFDPEAGKVSGGFAAFGSHGFTALFVLIIIAVSFIVILAITLILKNGRNYYFSANDREFKITAPSGRETVLPYEDIIGITFNERKFFLASKGIDITIRTKTDAHIFRYIHTPISKVNGITHTPFNIIRERTGLIKKPDYYNY